MIEKGPEDAGNQFFNRIAMPKFMLQVQHEFGPGVWTFFAGLRVSGFAINRGPWTRFVCKAGSLRKPTSAVFEQLRREHPEWSRRRLSDHLVNSGSGATKPGEPRIWPLARCS